MASQSGDKIGRLVAIMTEVVTLLHEQGEDHWAAWLERDGARIADGDANGLDHVRQAFGGMGSINDAFPADEGGIGERLAEIYRLATQLKADWEAAHGGSLVWRADAKDRPQL
jgi:hypothetical protein